jgi:hypothetical protein
MSEQHPEPSRAKRPCVGRWVVRAGYGFTLGVLAVAIVESIRAWGETSSATLLGCTVAFWLASGVIAYGRLLRGQLAPGAFSVGRGVAGLPVSLGFAYYGPAIEHTAAWWALLLPNATYALLRHGIGLPHLCALLLTIALAFPELILSAAVTEAVVITPLKVIFGSDSPIVASARDLFGGIDKDGPFESTRSEESTVWGGKSELRGVHPAVNPTDTVREPGVDAL